MDPNDRRHWEHRRADQGGRWEADERDRQERLVPYYGPTPTFDLGSEYLDASGNPPNRVYVTTRRQGQPSLDFHIYRLEKAAANSEREPAEYQEDDDNRQERDRCQRRYREERERQERDEERYRNVHYQHPGNDESWMLDPAHQGTYTKSSSDTTGAAWQRDPNWNNGQEPVYLVPMVTLWECELERIRNNKKRNEEEEKVRRFQHAIIISLCKCWCVACRIA